MHKFKRRALSIFLAMAFVATSMPAAFAGEAEEFSSDMTIQEMTEVQGTDSEVMAQAPDETVNLAEVSEPESEELSGAVQEEASSQQENEESNPDEGNMTKPQESVSETLVSSEQESVQETDKETDPATESAEETISALGQTENVPLTEPAGTEQKESIPVPAEISAAGENSQPEQTQPESTEPASEAESEKKPEEASEEVKEKGILWLRASSGSGSLSVETQDGTYIISSDDKGERSAKNPAGEDIILTQNGWISIEAEEGSRVTVKAQAGEGYKISLYRITKDTGTEEAADAKDMDLYEMPVTVGAYEQEIEAEFEKESPYFISKDFDYSQFNDINLSSMRLIVGSYDTGIFVDDGSLISSYDGISLLQFEDPETTLKAYAYYYQIADFVEADTGVQIAVGDAPEYRPEEIASPVITIPADIEDPETGETEGGAAETVDTDTVMTEDENPFVELENAVYEASYLPVDIAVIDTGANGADESVSMLGADTYDYNGHGTAMLGYIREYVPDMRILSIKALGDDGKGDISAVYAAIEYAVERGARIINMSISALAGKDSSLIETAVNNAVQKGIIVVGAAGNNNRDARYYVPGKIESAYIIGACNIAGTKIESSNYGITLDYAMVAGSTSEATARFTGWLAYNGKEAIQDALKEGRIFRNTSTIGSSDAPEGIPDLFDISAVPSDYSYVELNLPPARYNSYVDHWEERDGYNWPVIAHDDIPFQSFAAPFQNLSGKLYDYGDTAHPTPDTDIYSTGRDYRSIAQINIYDDRFYSFTNDQGVKIIGVYQDDIGRTSPRTDGVSRYGWNLDWDEVNNKWSTSFSQTEFEHPFDIVLKGAAVDPYGKELDLTISFDQVIAVKHGSVSSYGIFPGVAYSPTDGGSRSGWWAPLWGEYTTPAAYNGTDFIAGILENEIWSCAAPLYNTSVTPEIQGNQFGGMNKISLSWKYSDGTAFTGNVDYAFKDIDSAQGGFLFIPESQGRPTNYIGFQETVSLNSGWSGVYKQVQNSDFQLYTINNNASYLCKVSDNDTFKTGFVAAAKGNIPAQLTWTGSWCGTIIYNLFSNNKGALRIEKSSSDTSVKKSLAGAKFGVYTSSDCVASSLVKTLTTDAQGIAATDSFELAPKTYYVKEITAPAGYQLNNNVFTAAVTAGNIAVVRVKEDPIPPTGSVQILKELDTSGLDTATVNAIKASSAYSVAGAQYTVYTDSGCTRKYGSAVLTITADANSNGMTGTSNVISDVPLGTYYIKETKAGTNLAMDTAVYTVTLTEANCATTQRPASKSKDKPNLGSVELTKVSKAPGITNGNTCYSLQGAVYGIYTNSACTAQYTTGTTDATGKFTVSSLPYGTYYIKEKTASKGYGLDTAVYTAQLGSSNTKASITSKEPVKADPISVMVHKQDDASGQTHAQGSGSFAGAEYTVKYYMNENWSGNPARTWIFVTKSNGRAQLTAEDLKSGSDALYLAANGAAVIPSGSFTIQETKAPTGYDADSTVYKYVVNGSQITYSGADAAGIVPISTTPVLDIAKGMTSVETALYGGVKVRKFDAELDKADVQGDAALAGAELSIINNSANPVWHDGKDHVMGEVVMTMTTDANGFAQTAADALPYGDYIIKETKAPRGYTVNSNWSVSFSIRENGDFIDTTADPVKDIPVKGGVKFQKVDAETLTNIAQGSATLEGAEISIYNISDKAVMVGDTLYAKEADSSVSKLRADGTAVLTVTTDASGAARTAADALPYGTYVAIETKASEGYTLNSDWNVTFQIREKGIIIDTSSDSFKVEASKADSAKNGWTAKTSGLGLDSNVSSGILPEQVIRRDFEFMKVNIDGQPLANIAFVLTRYDNHGNAVESHVFSTDSRGWYRSAQKNKSAGVNRLDGNVDGSWFVRDGKHADPTAEDAENAVWFGAQGNTVSGGSLVYGRYGIEELRTLSNEERHETLQRSESLFTVDEAGTAPVFLGTMVDIEVNLYTKVQDLRLGENMTCIGDAIEVRDEVSYDNIDARNEYILKVDYRDVETGESVGSSEVTFKPKRTSQNVNSTGPGKVVVDTTIDTTRYEGIGGRISAVSQLFQKYTIGGQQYDILVQSHNEDLSDLDETLLVPSVNTEAFDILTSDHAGAYSETAAIKDIVRMENLAAKSNYKLVAVAVNNRDKSELGTAELKFSTGRNVNTATRTMPEIMVDSTKLPGQSITVHEFLYFLDEDSEGNIDEILVGKHDTDLDPAQTVWYASLDTRALAENGIHAIEAGETTKITDTAYMDALVPGMEYVLKGVLMDAETKEKLLDDEGNEITAELTFTADASTMQKDLEFEFSLIESAKTKDAPIIAVAYVNLYHKDVLVATHEEIDDVDETVIIVPPRYKKYSDPDMTQETVVYEDDIVGYRISWSQAQYGNANVWLKDTLSEGLEYVIGSAKDGEGNSFEPDVRGSVLSWQLNDMPAGSYGTITYDVRVTKAIRKRPLADNNYETSVGIPDDWTDIGSLENPGTPDKEYANDLLQADVPVMTEEAVVYEGKDIEYALIWVNRFMTDATVELKDTLSAGLVYNEGSATLEPTGIMANEDGTTTLYWKIEANAHDWGRIGYTAKADTEVLEATSVFKIANDADVKVTRESEDPGNNPWTDVRELENPVPHYTIEKTRISNAPEKTLSEGSFGFNRGDVIAYDVEITNDGSVDITLDTSDIFEEDGMFDELTLDSIEGGNVTILKRNDTSAVIIVAAGSSAMISYSARTGMHTPEILAAQTQDDTDNADDGYVNIAKAANASVTYTDHDGNNVILTDGLITVVPADGSDPEEYDAQIPDLADRQDSANTPVQVPQPAFTVTKNRASEASAKVNSEGAYGFRRGDLIVYDVTVENTGALDVEVVVEDAFAETIAAYFEKLHISGIDGKELERVSDTVTKVLIPIGEKAVVHYEAHALLNAEELLSDSAFDRTKDLAKELEGENLESLMNDPSFDLLGYLNIATGKDAVAVYKTNDGRTVLIHGPEEDGMANITEIIDPEAEKTVQIGNEGEYADGLKSRSDAAHTPVQSPVPGYTISKARMTQAPEKYGEEGHYGFRRGDVVEYQVTVANTGDIDLEMTVSDRFEEDSEEYFESLAIKDITLGENSTELERLEDSRARIRLAVGENAVFTYTARVSDIGQELLSENAMDDGTGYVNTAEADEVEAVWTTNDGEEMRLDKDSNNGEFAEQLTVRESNAHTPIQAPNPHYILEKMRVEDASAKGDKGFGFMRQDLVTYEIEVVNDGGMDLQMDVTDMFSEKTAEYFEGLQFKGIRNKTAGRDEMTVPEEVDVTENGVYISLAPTEHAVITFQARIAIGAAELLSETAEDDGIGYENIAAASEVTAKWTTNDGVEKTIDKNTNDGEFYEALSDKQDNAATPVQVPVPGYEVTKFRVENAPEADEPGYYGFMRGDKVTYLVTVKNTGALDLETTLTDEFSEEISKYFDNVTVKSVYGEEIERINDATVRVKIPAGESATVEFGAVITTDAPELLSKSLKDDGTGHANTAKTYETVAMWTTNDGEEVLIDKDTNNGEFAEELSDKEDAANTPVQVPAPHYTVTKTRITPANKKPGTEKFGFMAGETVEYDIAIVNDGKMDLELTVNDVFDKEGSPFFMAPVITKVTGTELKRESDSETRLFIKAGERATVSYKATVLPGAAERLSDSARDDGKGYTNIGKITEVTGKWTTNDGTEICIDREFNGGEFAEELGDKEAKAHTPVISPKIHYTIEKIRLTDASEAHDGKGFGFVPGDVVQYHIVVTNDGETDLNMTVSDEFSKDAAQNFSGLKIVKVDGDEVERINDTTTIIEVRAGTKAVITYEAVVAAGAKEFLSATAKDDGKGYLNTGKASDVTGHYKTPDGVNMTVTEKDDPELAPKEDTSATPVRKPYSNYSIEKTRVTEAPSAFAVAASQQQAHSQPLSGYGFLAGDEVQYNVTVTNNGETELEMTVSDAFDQDADRYFSNLRILKVDGTEIQRIDESNTKLSVRAGAEAVVTYSATVAFNAPEILSGSAKDDGRGYRNTAKATEVTAKTKTPDGREIILTKDDDPELAAKEDTAHTPVQAGATGTAIRTGDDTSMPTWLIIGGAAIAVIVLLAVIVIIRRRTGRNE